MKQICQLCCRGCLKLLRRFTIKERSVCQKARLIEVAFGSLMDEASFLMMSLSLGNEITEQFELRIPNVGKLSNKIIVFHRR